MKIWSAIYMATIDLVVIIAAFIGIIVSVKAVLG